MEMVMKACEGRSESGLCKVIGVSRDKKGKALLVMQPMKGDLRNLIDSEELLDDSNRRDIMRGIARGLKNLHACGRIHKDVKASNILVNTDLRLLGQRLLHVSPRASGFPGTGHGLHVSPRASGFPRTGHGLHVSPRASGFPRTGHGPPSTGYGPADNCRDPEPRLPVSSFTYVDAYIGDYESVDGVFGTAFWRPPEVLKALRYGSPEDLKLAYLPAGDVYGFGMVLYEVLTRQIPLQGHSLNDYDPVISGARPDIPDDVSPEMRDLLLRCWHQDPHQRPSWTEIEKYF
jgi:serine/threonine protein kinase